MKKVKEVEIEEIEKAVIELYGSLNQVNDFAYKILKDCLIGKTIDYQQINELESKNKSNLLSLNDDVSFLSDESID